MKNHNSFIFSDITLRRWSFFSLISFLIIRLIGLIPPYFMKQIIDVEIPSNNLFNIFSNIFLFVITPFIVAILQTFFNYITICISRNKGNEIAIQIMKNLLKQPLSFFDNQNSAELLSYSGKESVNYIYFHLSEKPKYYAHIITVGIIFIILFKFSPLIAFLQLLFIPFAILPIKLFSKKLEDSIEIVLKKNAKINQIKTDLFRGIEFVKTMVIENKKINEIENANAKVVSLWGKIAAIDSLSSFWTSGFLTPLFTGLTFGLSAYLAVKSNLSIGTIVSILSYIAILYVELSITFQTQIDSRKQEAENQKLFSFLELTGELETEKEIYNFECKENIVFSHCYFSFDDFSLQDINLIINKGSGTGIIGKSGSGKSTIFDLLLKLYPLTDGKILIDQINLNEIKSDDLRRHLTRISQETFLFPGTIKDNMLLVNPNATNEDIYKALSSACLDTYIDSLPNRLETDVGEAGKLMSGGERQRLSLAQGILRNTPFLLLDEVTANLDSKTEQSIRENLYKLSKEKDITIISISHSLDFLKYADIIYEIQDGKVIKKDYYNGFKTIK